MLFIFVFVFLIVSLLACTNKTEKTSENDHILAKEVVEVTKQSDSGTVIVHKIKKEKKSYKRFIRHSRI